MFLFRTFNLQKTHKIILALSMELFNSILTFFTGFLGGIFSQKKDDKTNELQYVTSERKEWRNTLREIIPQLLNPPLDVLGYLNKTEIIKLEYFKTQIQIRFNPFDKNDNEIIDNIKKYINELKDKKFEESKKTKEELENQFASLLKHDWERVKSETKMKSFLASINIILFSLFLLWIKCEIYFLLNSCKCQCMFSTNFSAVTCILTKGIVFLVFLSILKKTFAYIISEIEEKCKFNKFMNKIFKINYRKQE